MVDGNLDTRTYSNSASIGSYDVCIFDEPVYNIKQIKVWPWDARWDRSNNLTLKLYGNAFEGSTINDNSLAFTDLLWSFDIAHEDTDLGHWEGKHEVITIPELNQIIEPSACNLSNFAFFPFIHGDFYILLERLDFYEDDTKIIEFSIDFNIKQCKITQCPVNTYQNGIDSDDENSLICERCADDHYAPVGATSVSNCTQCPFHRELKTSDSSWCSIQECMEVIITHQNGLYNPLDGIYYNLGKKDNLNVYISYNLNYVIQYNNNNKNYKIID